MWHGNHIQVEICAFKVEMNTFTIQSPTSCSETYVAATPSTTVVLNTKTAEKDVYINMEVKIL